MKVTFSIFAALVLLAGASAFAAGNGVERGDIQINTNASVPKGVEDAIETAIFSNCDLRGAARIEVSYFQMSQDSFGTTNDYRIQYQVSFKNDSRLDMIYAHALLHLQGSPETAIEIREFSSAICRSIP